MAETKVVNIDPKELEKLMADAEKHRKSAASRKTYHDRRNIKVKLFIAKAEKAGVKWPTEKDIDDYIKSHKE